MRSPGRRSGIVLPSALVACGVVIACGGPPEPKEPALVVAAPAPTAPGTPTPTERAPVEEPKALLVVARWKAPTRGAERALKALGFPISIESLIAEKAGAEAKILDFDGSIDLAMSLDPTSTDSDPKVLTAVSIPLRSFEDAVAVAEKEGERIVTVRPDLVRTSKAGKEDCELSRTPGPTAARLVCGPTSRDVDALGDWLLRGLAAAPPDSDDLVATVRARPLKDRYLTPLRTEAMKLGDQARAALAAQNITDPELVAAPGLVLDEGIQFLQDIEGIEMHIALGSTPPQVAAGGTLRFGARSAWLTRVIVDANDKAGPPPAMFWQEPKDAYSANWGRRGDPHLFDGVTHVLHKALALGLERLPIPPADKEAIEAFVAAAPRPSANWVTAQGLLHGGKKHPAGAKLTPAETLADMKVLATSTLGWTVVGVEAPAAEYVAWAKQGVDLYARAVRLVRAFAPKPKAGADDHKLDFIPKLTIATAPAGWPKGTVAFDLQVAYDSEIATIFLPHKKEEPDAKGAPEKKKKPPAAKGSITLRLAIVPDGDRTWIGFSADLDELKKHLNVVMSGAPPAGTLAARDGLEGLKEPGQTWGGFFSIGNLVDRAFEEVEKEKPAEAAEARALLAAMPNRAQTPFLLIGSGKGGPAPSNSAEVRLQAGTLADVGALVTFLLSPKGKPLLKKLDLP